MFSVCWRRLLKSTQLTLSSLHPVLSSRHIVQLQASRGIARGCVPVSILCSVPSVRVLFLIIAHQHTYARYSRLAAAPGRQCVYVGLSRHKSPRSSACTISQKAIWFRHLDYNPDRAQRLISSSMSWRLSTCNISSKSMHALLSNLADRQTDRWTWAKTCSSSFVPLQLSTHKITSKSVHNFFRYPAEMKKSGVNLHPDYDLDPAQA